MLSQSNVGQDFFDCSVIGDMWYISAEIQLNLFETAHIKLEVPYRSNQKDWKPSHKPLAKARKRIETWKRRLPENVLSDAIGVFTVNKSSKAYPEDIRKIVYQDPETGKIYIFLTNDFDTDALTIALLYKYRWSIELFFKWLKSHLKIKRFWGTSENAVRTQIYCVIITYCLVAIVQHDMKLERSIYEVLQILSISLTDKTPIRDLFNKQNFNNVNELNGSSEPSLFENLIY